MSDDMQFRLKLGAMRARQIDVLRDALQRIASEDYRGPEPSSVRIARQALAAYGEMDEVGP